MASHIPNMLTCLGKHNLDSFAILDGQDRHVILAPDLPTWNDSQPPQYRKSSRLPHRLLRIPDTNPFAGALQVGRGLPQVNINLDDLVPFIILPEDTTSPIRSATWRLHWPVVCRGTYACVGIAIRPNTPDSPFKGLLYWNLSSGSSNPSSALSYVHGLPAADFTMTLTVFWTSRGLLEVSLTYHFIDLPTNPARTLHREVWLGHSAAPSISLIPFISTAWGCAQIDMQFVGFLKSSRRAGIENSLSFSDSAASHNLGSIEMRYLARSRSAYNETADFQLFKKSASVVQEPM
ncbi:hypothetical protein ACTXT7_005870 [Hymenolepis weldensis]